MVIVSPRGEPLPRGKDRVFGRLSDALEWNGCGCGSAIAGVVACACSVGVFWLASRRSQIVTRRHNTIVVERLCRRVDQMYRQQRVHHETSISSSSLRRHQRDGTCRRPWCIGQHRPARFLWARGHRGVSAAAAHIPEASGHRAGAGESSSDLPERSTWPGETLAPTLRRLQCLWRTGLFRAEQLVQPRIRSALPGISR